MAEVPVGGDGRWRPLCHQTHLLGSNAPSSVLHAFSLLRNATEAAAKWDYVARKLTTAKASRRRWKRAIVIFSLRKGGVLFVISYCPFFYHRLHRARLVLIDRSISLHFGLWSERAERAAVSIFCRCQLVHGLSNSWKRRHAIRIGTAPPLAPLSLSLSLSRCVSYKKQFWGLVVWPPICIATTSLTESNVIESLLTFIRTLSASLLSCSKTLPPSLHFCFVSAMSFFVKYLPIFD